MAGLSAELALILPTLPHGPGAPAGRGRYPETLPLGRRMKRGLTYQHHYAPLLLIMYLWLLLLLAPRCLGDNLSQGYLKDQETVK